MKLFLALHVLVFLCACTQKAHYRTIPEKCSITAAREEESACDRHSIEVVETTGSSEPLYTLGFVEFDDEGAFHDRRQLDNLLNELERIEYPIVVVYIHGWKHNAAPDDSNVLQFRELLKRIVRSEKEVTPLMGKHVLEEASGVTSLEPPSRTVVGVYLGWRGLSIYFPGLKETTFWGRESAAHQVGAAGAAKETLLKLESLVNRKNDDSRDSVGELKQKSQLILIGHSFGAGIAYSSISQTLVDRYRDTCHPPQQHKSCERKGFGDLVILVNPAFEAAKFEELHSLVSGNDVPAYTSHEQLPVFAILNSEGDKATKYLFPAARALSQPFGAKKEDKDEKEKRITAVGHYEQYHTHRLSPLKNNSDYICSETLKAQQYIDTIGFFMDWRAEKEENFEKYSDEMEYEKEYLDLVQVGTQFRRKTDVYPDLNPYLSISIEKQLIPNHNDIYDCRVLRFMQLLISINLAGSVWDWYQEQSEQDFEVEQKFFRAVERRQRECDQQKSSHECQQKIDSCILKSLNNPLIFEQCLSE